MENFKNDKKTTFFVYQQMWERALKLLKYVKYGVKRLCFSVIINNFCEFV